VSALADRRDLLAAILDTLVPPDGDFPGAGAVALDHIFRVAAASRDVEALVSNAMDATEQIAGAGRLRALAPDDREAVLRRVETANRDVFDALVRHVYDGYYSHPAVVERLGLDPRPPQPHGHRIAPADLPDLARVAGRGPIYRPA